MGRTQAQQRKLRVKKRKVARTKAWKESVFGRKRRHIIHPRSMENAIDRAANVKRPENEKKQGFLGRMFGKLFGRRGS